jgi:hypothetical protein
MWNTTLLSDPPGRNGMMALSHGAVTGRGRSIRFIAAIGRGLAATAPQLVRPKRSGMSDAAGFLRHGL